MAGFCTGNNIEVSLERATRNILIAVERVLFPDATSIEGIFSSALERAFSLAADRIGSLFRFKEDLASMTRSLGMIRDLLSNADERQYQNRAVPERLLRRLEGVAFDADNVLDEVSYEFLHHKVKSRNRFFFSANSNIAFRWRLASKIGDIHGKLNDIIQEAQSLEWSDRILPSADAARYATSQQTLSVAAPIIGRADDRSKIVKMLLRSSTTGVSLIPITGMGGLGKTTLAKSIYNNEQIDEHFDKKIWVCVSEKVQIVKLFELILLQLTGKKIEVDDRNVINEEIGKQLGGKRVLLVLDDVWNGEREFWIDFFVTMDYLNVTEGSCCLITTRLEGVADAFTGWRNVDHYKLGKLSDNECWSIVKGLVVAREEIPQELEAIRGELRVASSGLPLAASLLGGLLRIKPKEEWLSIIRRGRFTLGEDENMIEQILKLSFDNLPSLSIQKCFAYCSMFSKDTEIERDLLIELWMVEGFLQPNCENESTMEDKGDQYMRILLQSSLLEEVKDSPKTCYKMHDLVHDFASFILRPYSIELENGRINNSILGWYLALNSVEGLEEVIILNISTSLRTLFVERPIPGDILQEFQYLHVLKLSGVDVKELPSSIGKLKHLRLLDLSYSGIKTLTESLCKLYLLQTLRTDGCMNLTGLPERTSNLISLRHLHFYKDDAEFQMPLEMGQLACLQTLKFFNIGEETGRQIEELGSLKDVRGKLVIRNLHLVNGKERAELANLSAKPNLLKLELIWGSSREGANLDGDVLEGLRPHPNLKELVITNFMGDEFPEWFVNLPKMLDKLVDLRLINCKRFREFPMLGQLPFLQYLELKGLTVVTYLDSSFYGVVDVVAISDSRSGRIQTKTTLFPALKTLKLDSMPNLVKWTEAFPTIYVFPCLENLTIQYCPRLTSIPSQFPALKTLKLDNMAKFEGWMEVSPTIEGFPCVENLTIQYCPRLTSIPSHFPTIRELKILTPLIVKNSMPLATIRSNVTTLAELCIHSVSEITCFPSDLLFANRNLQILRISSCSNLTQVVPSFQDSGTSLRELSIHGCEKLVELPQGLDSLSCLEILSVEECPNLVSFPGVRLAFLRHLKIAYCDQLSHLPLGMTEFATELRSLRISHCPSLNSLPLHLDNKTLLSSLWISNCPKWTSVPKELKHVYPYCLRELRIGCFSDLVQFDHSFRECIAYLRELHTVGLYGHPKWTELPYELQRLQALRLLFVSDFGIEALPDWLGKLSYLEELGLYKCKKLKDMPSDEAMKCLTNFTRLSIFGCPLVKKRCMQHYGPGSGWSTPKFELNTD